MISRHAVGSVDISAHFGWVRDAERSRWKGFGACEVRGKESRIVQGVGCAIARVCGSLQRSFKKYAQCEYMYIARGRDVVIAALAAYRNPPEAFDVGRHDFSSAH